MVNNMSVIKTYQDLEVWQKARELVKETYQLSKRLPKEETYALSDQMRRAAVSIPSNIAEGFGRSGSKDYPHFLTVALGSTYELETQLALCEDLRLLEHSEITPALALCTSIAMMLNKLIKRLST